jgi:NAD(P)-dependent dehydrogenase (short-subunit alcohol dehydrogenase family)
MKNYVIIGASTGIGLATAQQLAAAGHQVFGTYNKNKPTEAVQNLQYFPLNVTDSDADMSWAPAEIHGVVYCPGSINLKPFARIKPEDFTSDFELQVVGAIRVLQTLMPNMKHAEPVSIVLFSTVAVQTGFTFHTQVSASKGALEGLTKALAAEMAPRMRVNCIAPSLTDTPLAGNLLGTPEKKEASAQRHPLKKVGTPENIAHLACFLLGEQSAWMTGQILHLDGGMGAIK